MRKRGFYPGRSWQSRRTLRTRKGQAIGEGCHLIERCPGEGHQGHFHAGYALPLNQKYKVISMQRKMDEILASQRKMLERWGEPSDRVSDREMALKFDTHLRKVLTWLTGQKNMEILIVGYNGVIANPRKEARRIARFLDDLPIVEKMIAAVDQHLYRQRSE